MKSKANCEENIMTKSLKPGFNHQTHNFPTMGSGVQCQRSGTVTQFFAMSTISPASNTPYPNRWLNSMPAPLMRHLCLWLGSPRWLRLEVSTVKCWTSLHVNCGLCSDHGTFNKGSYDVKIIENVSNLASRARAKTPAASGAAAEVPECLVVHLPYKSVVAYGRSKSLNYPFYTLKSH